MGSSSFVRAFLAAALAIAPVAAASAVVAGCASSQGRAGGVPGGDATDAAAHQAAVAAGDAAFADRVDRDQLELAVVKYEEAVRLKADDWQTHAKLARACHALADQWLFFEKEQNPAQYLDAYEQGYTYAQRGMAALSPEFAKRLDAGVDVMHAVAVLDQQAVELLYWYATNLSRWASAQDITVVLTFKDRIYSVMEQVYKTDPDFFYGAADRYSGAYHSTTPTFAGGDLDKGWTHFQAATRIEPRFAATYVLIAEFYSPKRQDEALFDEMLAKVADMPDDIIPELAAETRAEKKKVDLLRKRNAEGEFPF